MKDLTFVVLNSAWNIDAKHYGPDEKKRGDKGYLWLGQPQLMKMRTSSRDALPGLTENPDVVITLYHHPADWLADEDHYHYYDNPYRPAFEYVTDFSHIILNGHTHAIITYPDQVSQRSIAFTGGATYGSRGYWNTCEILEVNPTKRSVKQSILKFDPTYEKWELQRGHESYAIKQQLRPQKAHGEIVPAPLSYYPDRGWLINPSDGERNVAFRADTFNNIFNFRSWVKRFKNPHKKA